VNASLIPPRLQLIAICILGLFLIWVVHLIRHKRLSLRDSLLWFLSTALALAVTLFPESLRWVAVALSIAIPSNAVFAFAFLYVLLNVLSVTISISGSAVRIRRLAQECSLLRGEIEELRTIVRRAGKLTHS
jgi:hypothetical protein